VNAIFSGKLGPRKPASPDKTAPDQTRDPWSEAGFVDKRWAEAEARRREALGEDGRRFEDFGLLWAEMVAPARRGK